MSSSVKPSVDVAARALNNQRLTLEEIKQSSQSFKTWQIALAIGIPAAAIVGYLYYSKSSRSNSKQNKIQEVKSGAAAAVASETQQTESPPKPKTTMESVIEVKNMGNKYFQQKKYKEAFDCYAQAIDLCPLTDKDELPKLYQNRAAAAENLKLFEKCIEDCTRALELDSNYSKALLRRAKVAEQIGNLDMAFEDLTALCIFEKLENKTTLLHADRLVKRLAEQRSREKFKNRVNVPISRHFVNNFYIGLLNDPVYKNQEFLHELNSSENESSAMKQAMQFFDQGDFASCINSCTKEIDADGQYAVEALNLRGSLFMLQCQYRESIEDFNQVLHNSKSSNRTKSNTLIKITALNLQKGDDYEAFVNYEKAIEIDPQNEDIYCNRAQVLAMKGRFDESFKDFDKSIELNPNHKIAKLQKAFFEFRKFYTEKMQDQELNNNPSVIKAKLETETRKLGALVKIFSDIPEASSLYAQVLSEQEEYAQAEEYYRIALDKDPENAALIVQRALNLMQLRNEADEAITMLNSAISVDVTCEFAYEALATVEIQRGNIPRAIELFEKAIDLARNEEAMINVYSLLLGAQTQYKMLKGYNNYAEAMNFLNPQ